MSGLLERVISTNRRRFQDRRFLVDLVFVGLITVFALIDVVGEDVSAGQRTPDFLAYVIAIVAAVSLVWRRHAPIAVLTVVTISMVTYWMRDRPSFLALIGLTAIYAVAAHCENRRRAWIGIGLSIIALMVGAGVSILQSSRRVCLLQCCEHVGLCVCRRRGGGVIRNREMIFVDTQRRVEVAEADVRAEAQRAVALERRRIAREMHDVVAHGMSVIAVQAAAAQEIAHTNPDKTVEVLSRIENVGRESLSEMRRMLGVLREVDGGDASLSPEPSLSDLAEVVARSVESGVATELVIDGNERDLPPGIELAAFRIVQEALTNVRKHGGRSASASVCIGYQNDALTIEVNDDGAGASTSLSDTGGGHGLIGIRERVEIYGGEFSAGPLVGGGYSVKVILPLTEPRPGVVSATPIGESSP